MKTRAEIKKSAKENMKASYGACIGVTLLSALLSIFTMAGTSILAAAVLKAASLLSGTASIIASILSIFFSTALGIAAILFQPVLFMSVCSFFVSVYINLEEMIADWFSDLFPNFFRKIGGYCWMQLFVFLWSLLFVIPGIIKRYAYSMTPYILADCPHVKACDALKISIRMTQGYKWKIFVMEFSFIGWTLLSLLTGGILYGFYVFPYMQTTMAGVYVELKHNAIEKEIVTAEEFEEGALRLAV